MFWKGSSKKDCGIHNVEGTADVGMSRAQGGPLLGSSRVAFLHIQVQLYRSNKHTRDNIQMYIKCIEKQRR